MNCRVVSGLVAVVLALQFAMASPVDAAKKKVAADATEGVYLRLHTLYAPLRNPPKGYGDTAPVSIITLIPDESKLEFVCERGPRLHAVILETLHAHPIRLTKKRQMKLKKQQKALLKGINKTLRRKVVSAVVVVPGVKSKKEIQKSLGIVIGCRGILLELEKKKEAAAKKKAQEEEEKE